MSLVIRRSLDEADSAPEGAYDWVAVDLDGVIAPSEGVRLARQAWPEARVAVLSYWWSERDVVARDLADVVIHKPLRSPEVLALLRALRPEREEAREPEEAVPLVVG